MELTPRDRRLLHALEGGLPRVPRPYADIAAAADLGEAEVIERIGRLIEDGTIRRFGLVVHHRELGYRANVMVVWDVPDPEVDRIGAGMGQWPSVTLCYRRTRRPPQWPYNLYCMIHGKSREAVHAEIEQLTAALALDGVPRAVLFSRHRIKQCGARYRPLSGRDGVKS
jgi:DNA-binding Lrp family transcriptional regulator